MDTSYRHTDTLLWNSKRTKTRKCEDLYFLNIIPMNLTSKDALTTYQGI